MYRRAESVESSYEALVRVLTVRDKLELVANVNRTLNKEIMSITKAVKDIIEALEKVNEPTLHLVAPSYYVLRNQVQAVPGESRPVAVFRAKLRKYLDEKFWTSINALHWIACFLDPSFKNFHFLPQSTREDAKFKRDLLHDLDGWLLAEMMIVAQRTNDAKSPSSSDG